VTLAIMSAIRAASAAFLFSAAYSLARYNLRDWASILLALLCLVATLFSLASAPTLIIIAAVLGIIGGYRKRGQQA
jgi:chromate transporter